MRGFIQRTLGLHLEARLAEIVKRQQAIILELQSLIVIKELEEARSTRDLIESFLIALDQPEHEEHIRSRLMLGLRDLQDHVARLEEHVSA